MLLNLPDCIACFWLARLCLTFLIIHVHSSVSRRSVYLLCSGCDVNGANFKNKLPLYTAIDRRADNKVNSLIILTNTIY